MSLAKKVQMAPAPAPVVSKMCGARGVVGPAWTRGEIEKPAATKDMGGWTSLVYTQEQQIRLGVDEQGNKVAASAAPQSAPASITPQYAAALLNSPNLLSALCRSYFKKYDTNRSGILELGEIRVLCQDLHESLGLTFSMMDDEDDEAIRGSIAPYSKGGYSKGEQAQLLAEEFPAWFTNVMEDSISLLEFRQQLSMDQIRAQFELAGPAAYTVKVKSLSGEEIPVKVLASMAMGTLREIAASSLDLPSAQTRLALGEEVLPDSATLEELQIGPDSELSALVMNSIQVKRHVYNMRGGAPPHRGYLLVASDEIELLCDETLGNQMQSLATGDGYPGGKSSGKGGPQMYAFQATPSQSAPKKWEGGMNEVSLQLQSTAEETFGVDGFVDLAVLLPMRGMD